MSADMDAAVASAARAASKHHCGPDADLDASNAAIPESIYNADTDADEPLDTSDWEPYLTELWEGWMRAGITAALPHLRESWEKELEDDIENARGQEGDVNFAEDNRAAGWEAALDRIELRFDRASA